MGRLLAEFRRARRWSQMDLALEADVSARHISFIENGRSVPSRALVLKLANALALSHRDANALLHSYGYVSEYSQLPLSDSQMAPIRQALSLMLDNHAPFPAAVLDGNWNLLMANTPLTCMLKMLLGESDDQPVNMLKATFDPQGLRPVIDNWEEVAGALLRRLHLQVFSQPQGEQSALYRQLLSMDPPANWREPSNSSDGPTLVVTLKTQNQRLELFSTLSTFGTSQDVNVQELVIESYFPANDTTRTFFHALMREQGG